MNPSVPLPFQPIRYESPSHNPGFVANGIGEDLIFIGIGGLAVLVALTCGFLSHRLVDSVRFSVPMSLVVLVLVIIA